MPKSLCSPIQALEDRLEQIQGESSEVWKGRVERFSFSCCGNLVILYSDGIMQYLGGKGHSKYSLILNF